MVENTWVYLDVTGVITLISGLQVEVYGPLLITGFGAQFVRVPLAPRNSRPEGMNHRDSFVWPY